MLFVVGLANASFGIECARLAGVPNEVLLVAGEQSAMLEENVKQKMDVVRFVSTLSNA